LLQGALSVHTDDLYDIDDCLEISEVDGQHIHLESTSERIPLEPKSAYHVIPPEVLVAYVARRAKQSR
jgi:hypothetical protein